MNRSLAFLFPVLVLVSLTLAGCGGGKNQRVHLPG
jgi:predicted small secreted protein